MERVGILVVCYGSRGVAMVDAFSRSKKYSVEVYVADMGQGFPVDSKGIPRITDALQYRTSLSSNGEAGIGLNLITDGSDHWEIENNGFVLAKGREIEKAYECDWDGVMVRLLKYMK